METKQQLIEKLQNLNEWYQKQPTFAILLKLVKATDEDDEDFKEVLEDEMGEEIITLFLEGYDSEGLLKWLSENNFDLFNNYRFADRVYRDDYESDEDFIENSGAFYMGEEDCLMYNKNTGCYVIRW